MLRNNKKEYNENEAIESCVDNIECHPSHKPQPTKSPHPTPSATIIPPSQSPTSDPSVTATPTSSPTHMPSVTPSPSPEPDFPAFFNVSTLDGKNGFKITGKFPGDLLGMSVAHIGDVNGDGLPDITIGAPGANYGLGEVYVIFGTENGYPSVLNVGSLNGENGFTITHNHPCNLAGGSRLAGIGDMNGDGVSDVLVSCGGNNYSQAFVLFGNKNGFQGEVSLNFLNGTNGFSINPININDYLSSCDGGSDVNYDGLQDVILGFVTGYASVVLSSLEPFPAQLNISSLTGDNGFNILGTGYSWSVAMVHDINGDGIGDAFAGSYTGQGNNYMVGGSRGGFPPSFNVTGLTGYNGFDAVGVNQGDATGIVNGGNYDVNGDGKKDAFITGANANNATGQGYVIFGADGDFPAEFFLDQLNGNNGFKITGISQEKQITRVVGLKDINGDGIDDILVGVNIINAKTEDSNLDLYVIYGRKEFQSEIKLETLDGTNGFVIGSVTKAPSGSCCQLSPISGTADIRGNCGGDLIIGDPYANNQTGAAYVIFGHGSCEAESHDYL